MSLKIPKALPVIAGVLAAMLAPTENLAPSAWAAKNLIVADGPRAGGRWDPRLAPYVTPIIDAFAADGAVNFGAVRKSAQSGLTEGFVALVGSYIAQDPCRIGYAVPTIDAMLEFNREKLAPSIAQTPALKRKVKPQRSRSSSGSTERTKRYPGGSLSLINANSAVDLRSRTLKIGVGDEIDAWPDDLGEEGDPLDLYKARFIAFHATADWRLAVLSTPTLVGHSRIDTLFAAGDQRYWHVKCPSCGEEIPLAFKHLKFNRVAPFKTYYVAQCCGHPIEHHEKAELVRAGRFIATNAEGVHPSWHVDALISQFTTWDKIAESWWAAQGDEKKLKVFFNTWLGLAFELRGDAPDHVRLLERREDYEPGQVPADALLLTAGCDVQHNGIWFEVVGYGADGQSWSIDHGFFEGDTTDPRGGAFLELTKFYDRNFPDAFGAMRQLDALAIDAGDGGRANQVYAWARRFPRAFAIKGQPGWATPAIGTPTKVSITLRGKKIAGGAMVWPVGTWALKATYYGNLRKDGRKAGAEIDPAGYCHHNARCDERYFKQQTAEYLKTTTVRGRSVRMWQETGPNHLLDCRIYSMAMADYLGLARMTAEQWAELRRLRGTPIAIAQPDMVAPEAAQIAARAPLLKPKVRKRRIVSRGID